MRFFLAGLIITTMVGGASLAKQPRPHILRLAFDKNWRAEAKPPFMTRLDRRGLFWLYHPWEPSRGEAFAECFAPTVTIPADWQPPFLLHFYCSDDYHADGYRVPPDSWLGQISLIGHRFKQVLIDDKVVWEMDVADAETQTSEPRTSESGIPTSAQLPSRLRLDVTPHVTAGKPFRLAFRVVDKVASDERLPMDYRHIGDTEKGAAKDSDPWKFMTHVYVGDVVITDATYKESVVGRRPSSELVVRHEAQRSAVTNNGTPLRSVPDYEHQLTLEAPAGIPPDGFPVTSGVPLPMGAVRDVNALSLKDPRGRLVPLQTEVMNLWEDGSVRWALLDFIAKGVKHGDRFTLSWGKRTKRVAPLSPVVVKEKGKQKVVSTGRLNMVFGGELRNFVENVRFPTQPRLLNALIQSSILLERGEVGVPIWESIEVTARGPVRATIELQGHLTNWGTKQRIGRCVARVNAYAGLPYLRLFYRIYNDKAEMLKFFPFSLIARLDPFGEPDVAWVAWSTKDKIPLKGDWLWLKQSEVDVFTVNRPPDTEVTRGQRSEGWMAQSDGKRTAFAAVRHFWQQSPKQIIADYNSLCVNLFTPTEKDPFFQPTEGEAKRHEILLAFMPEALDTKKCSAIGLAFQHPPRLFDADYFCKSGGFGYAHPHNEKEFPELTAFMRKTYGEVKAEQFYKFGIRHFGDQPYGNEGFWCNNYYDRMQGFASEYLMTGDRRWFDHLEATARHVMDVDTCHYSSKHPDWVGGWHGYNGVNHTAAPPWAAMQRTSGMLAYWRLTGDVDARENALGVADWLIRTSWGMGSRSVRDHAGVLMAATMAYDETHDPKYLELARRLARDAISRMDLRRGCYAEVHGNYSYRGNVPWMCAQLAEPLFYYYKQSGDVLAADAVVGLAESIITENMTPDAPGDIYGYSHNPHFAKTSNYHVLIAPTLCYAYELTGDAEFLRCARAAYEQTIREGTVNSVVNCYWNTPTLLYYLNKYSSTIAARDSVAR